MAGRSIWVTILLLALSGVVQAQWHFIKLALVGAMGLTGMWMMHKLAQDFNKIRNPKPAALAKLFFKRSVGEEMVWDERRDELFLEEALREDPMGCAQRMVCQIAASQRDGLTNSETNILDMFSGGSSRRPRGAWEVFRVAAELGKHSSEKSCIQNYPKCPYSRSEITRLIQQVL